MPSFSKFSDAAGPPGKMESSMSTKDEKENRRILEIRQKIEKGFYFTRQVYEVIAVKVIKEIFVRKLRS